eukprot:Hpha_TRINITY_DN15862_c1_g4::TRINITY_DN15862_c1_g4_i1::g.191769::m.191769
MRLRAGPAPMTPPPQLPRVAGESEKVTVVHAATCRKTTVQTPISVKDLRDAVRREFEFAGDFELVGLEAETPLPGMTLVAQDSSARGEGVGDMCAEMTVDITPSVNVLLQGGDGYDFCSALAELVDNSLQSTAAQRDRRVEVSLGQDEQGAPVLRIRDNGRGMSPEGLRRWACLGHECAAVPQWVAGEAAAAIASLPELKQFSQHAPPKKAKSHSRYQFESRVTVADHLSSDFSRYGVGSKKAVFNIGRKVKVTSRHLGCMVVGECELSEAAVKDAGWRAKVRTRNPKPEELELPSFTEVAIGDLTDVYVRAYDAPRLRFHLGHIYHYYIWGPNGSKRHEPWADEGSARAGGVPFYPIQLQVDGMSVAQSEDGESPRIRVRTVSLSYCGTGWRGLRLMWCWTMNILDAESVMPSHAFQRRPARPPIWEKRKTTSRGRQKNPGDVLGAPASGAPSSSCSIFRSATDVKLCPCPVH